MPPAAAPHSNSFRTPRPDFALILLLGSYDPRTREVLLRAKVALAEGLAAEPWIAVPVLLDDVEFYRELHPTPGEPPLEVIAERSTAGFTVYMIREDVLVDVIDGQCASRQFEPRVELQLRQSSGARLTKLSLLEKVQALARSRSLTFLIRDSELTRGGEYIELAYLLGQGHSPPGRMWFLKREGFALSEMASVALDEFGIHMRSYRSTKSLQDQIVRLARLHATRTYPGEPRN